LDLERKSDEQKWFDQWKQTGSKPAFHQLYYSMKPLLSKAAMSASYGSNIPRAAHEIWAAQNMLDALHTFDPKKGVALQTHVYGAVSQKAKRLNYQYSNMGQIPETRAIQVGNFNSAVANLREELGREPSAVEIADDMSLGLRDVERLRKEIQKDLSLDGMEDHSFDETPKEREVLQFLYYDLNPEQQVIYDYMFGMHGKPRLVKKNEKINFDEIARRSGFSSSKARALFNQVKTKFEKEAR
jgi:DNA-directed RNA polymerase specialized sigma subunit